MAEIKTGQQVALTYGPNLKSSAREINQHAKKNAAKGNDLIITDPKAKNAVRIYRDSVIGQELRLQLRPMWKLLNISQDASDEFAERFELLFTRWANSVSFDADVKRKQNFTSILRTLASSKFATGDAFASIEWKKGQLGLFTCLNIIDPARICNPNHKPNSPTLQNGIEFNAFGAVIAYYVRSGHPGDLLNRGAVSWKRVPKYSKHGRPLMLHSFEVERPEQNSGISRFSAVADNLKKNRAYNDAEVDRSMLAASYGAYIKSNIDYQKAMDVAGQGVTNIEDFVKLATKASIEVVQQFYQDTSSIGGAKFIHLLPGEDIELIQGEQTVEAFEAFNSIFGRDNAAGLGIDPHSLNKNYSDVSYNAARASADDSWRSYMPARQEIISDFALPIVSCLMEEFVDSGLLKLPKGVSSFYESKQALCSGSFMGAGKPNIDQVKTAKAHEIELKNGTISPSEICATRGVDYRDVCDQRARDKKYAVEQGLKPEDFNPELLFNINQGNSERTENKTDKEEDEDDDD
ncbi:MAG: phage portal protein [Rhizobiales bacterium]|nr:phage portal protein [Hyphomicrobiales bacterium]